MLRRPSTSPAMRALGVASCLALIGAAGLAAWAMQPPQIAYADTATTRENAVSRALGAQLLDALQDGNADEARQLISAGADVNYFRDGDGTPLIMAVRHGDASIVTTLLEAGANVNQAAPGDGSALIAASRMGNLGLVTQLVAAGADVNGYVPDDETPLINAAGHNRIDVARFLIARGADVNLEVEANTMDGVERRSPMSMARRGGHDAMIRLLRQNGARG